VALFAVVEGSLAAVKGWYSQGLVFGAGRLIWLLSVDLDFARGWIDVSLSSLLVVLQSGCGVVRDEPCDLEPSSLPSTTPSGKNAWLAIFGATASSFVES